MADSSSQRKYLAGIGLAVLLSIVLVSQIAIYKGEYAESLSYYRSLAHSELEKNHTYLFNTVEKLKGDLSFISKTPPFKGIIRADKNNGIDPLDGSTLNLWNNRLNQIFTSYVLTNNNVTQIRYIGFKNEGLELVRVDRVGDKIEVIHSDSLQKKGTREYVANSIGLNPGEFYLSDINLNRENGIVEKPYKPMLRIASPIFDESEQIFGILIINYDFGEVINYMNLEKGNWDKFFMINKSGDFIVHPDKDKQFAFDKGSPYRWNDEFPKAGRVDFSKPASISISRLNGDFYVETAPYKIEKSGGRSINYLYAVKFPRSIIASRAFENTLVTSISVISGLVLIGVISFLILRNIRQSTEVTMQQARLAAVVNGAHEAIISEDTSGEIIDWNRGAERLFGISRNDAIGKSIEELKILPKWSNLPNIDQNKSDNDLERSQEVSFINSKGDELSTVVYTSKVWGGVGEMIGVSRMIHDITRRKSMEVELRQLNENLESKVEERTAEIKSYQQFQTAILDSSPALIMSTNLDGDVIQLNPAALKALGIKDNGSVSKINILDILDSAEVKEHAEKVSLEISKEFRPGIQSLFARVIINDIEEGEWTFIPKEGNSFPVYLYISSILDDDGEINGYVLNATDITEITNNRSQIELSKKRLISAAQVAGMGMWEWDIASGDLVWDDMMFEIYQLPIRKHFEGVVYEDWHNAVHPEDIDEASSSLNNAVLGKGIYDVTFRIVIPDGSIRFVKAGAVVERNSSGDAIRVVGFNLDITKQIQHENLLERAIEKTNKANIAKSEFLANMSHEIRTPMNAVLGTIQLLQHTAMTSQQVDYVSKTEVAAKSLLNIINDILDFSKIEAGKLELDIHDTKLEQLLSNIGNITAGNIGEKKIDVVLDLDASVPRIIRADSHRLQQVLINLVSNAIKFTNKGNVRIEIDRVEGDDGEMIRFSVIDSGIGISSEQQTRIFNAFSQAESSTSRKFGGTGLGLTISNRLVELMGGTLTCDSSPGLGSRFEFSIPLVLGHTKAREVVIPKSMKDINVLIVEDNQYARLLLLKILKSFGWNVISCDSGEKVIEEIKIQLSTKEQQNTIDSLDVILIDWDMPELCGWRLVESVRGLLGERNIPILPMVTANERSLLADKNRAKKALINGFLQKPLTPSQILNAVADSLNQDNADYKFITRQTTERLSGIKILLVEDNPTNQQVGQSLLSTQGALVVCASDGDEAVTILRDEPERFDIVLMDIQMPVKDGYTATLEIRNNIGLVELPIIAMTANVMSSDVAQAEAAGMDGHIGKPFEIESLVELIERFTLKGTAGSKKKRITKTTASTTEELAVCNNSNAKKLSALNWQSSLKRMQGNENIYNRALNTFLIDFQEIVSQFQTHWPSSVESHKMLAHTLKGMSATIGAEKFSFTAKQMEECLLKGDSLRFDELRKLLDEHYKEALVEVKNYLQQVESDKNENNLTIDDDELILGLQELFAKLQDSDMAALDNVTRLKKRLSGDDEKILSPLFSQVEGLRFESAIQEFEHLKVKADKFNGIFE